MHDMECFLEPGNLLFINVSLWKLLVHTDVVSWLVICSFRALSFLTTLLHTSHIRTLLLSWSCLAKLICYTTLSLILIFTGLDMIKIFIWLSYFIEKLKIILSWKIKKHIHQSIIKWKCHIVWFHSSNKIKMHVCFVLFIIYFNLMTVSCRVIDSLLLSILHTNFTS